MKTRIIVDSTSDLMPAVKERVRVVPLTVHFGEEEYIDGVTIDHKTFYEKLIETDFAIPPSAASSEPMRDPVRSPWHFSKPTDHGEYTNFTIKNRKETGISTSCLFLFRKKIV